MISKRNVYSGWSPFKREFSLAFVYANNLCSKFWWENLLIDQSASDTMRCHNDNEASLQIVNKNAQNRGEFQKSKESTFILQHQITKSRSIRKTLAVRPDFGWMKHCNKKRTAAAMTALLVLVIALAVAITVTALPTSKNQILGSNHYQDKIVADYLTKRKAALANDTKQRTGQSIVLTDSEKKANAILMRYKKEELDLAFKTEQFIGTESFVTARSKIEQSKVFKIIKQMPKGAVLHLHDLAMADYRWLISNITTMKICYMCYNTGTQKIQFKIAYNTPNSTANCQWISVPSARSQAKNQTEFDNQLYSNLTMTDGDPKKLYPTQKALWEKFGGIFSILSGILGFNDAFAGYYAKGLEELKADNIQYAEIRSLLIPLYDVFGKTYTDPEYSLNIYKNMTEKFVSAFKDDFYGAKFIYIQTRMLSNNVIQTAVNKAVSMMKKYPDLVSGFDLVGHEDPGYTLLHYIKELLAPQSAGEKLPFFFHAGETNWEGQSVDYNLIDALLLNTKRIGHGFALPKHQTLMNEAKAKGVAAEVCPISNQILGLVSDMRNHPASVFLDQNFPITVNPDDPPIWGATGLSYDFYELFMAMTRYDDDLRLLKQLAINSIEYSSLDAGKKKELYAMWNRKWDQFIRLVNKEHTP